ncbi:hypothetical protein IID04_07380 [PVC group bacterium]|nr:hypothetical protein [PVC group bacterium]
MSEIKIEFEASFIEEGIFYMMKDREDKEGENSVSSYHRERNRIYEEFTGRERDAAFQKFYKGIFASLGCDDQIRTICEEFKMLTKPKIRILVRNVAIQKHEGAELFWSGSDMTVLVSFQAIRLTEPDSLSAFLYHEIMHVSDMLDPKFVYSPHPDLGGRSDLENQLIRERFRILWDLYVAARLIKKGIPSLISLEKQKEYFNKAFSLWHNDKRNTIWESISRGHCYTQNDLLRFSKDERLLEDLGKGGLRCPICEFSSFDPVLDWDEQNAPVIEQIRKDYPAWRSEAGVCQQCFDLYSSRLKMVSS